MSYENIQTLQVGGNNESSNHSFSGMNRPGGVMEVRVSSQPDQGELIDARRGVSIQAGLGGVTTTTAGRTVSAPAVSTVHSSEFSGGHSDFLATARNNGIPAMGRLTPSSVVQYQGMEVDLATLEAIGVVRQSGNGYESVGGGNNEVQQGQQQVPQGNQAGVELFPDTVESAVADAIAPVPQHLYDQAIAVALESGLDAVGWAEIAYQSGITPEEARQRAEFVVQAFSMQADQIAKSNGIETPSEVWEWASQERKSQLADAHRQLAFGRSTTALRSLVNEYFTSVPPTVEALQKAGFAVRTDSSGQAVFNLNGTWMTPEGAARAGLI